MKNNVAQEPYPIKTGLWYLEQANVVDGNVVQIRRPSYLSIDELMRTPGNAAVVRGIELKTSHPFPDSRLRVANMIHPVLQAYQFPYTVNKK